MNTKQEEQIMAGVEGATLGDILDRATRTRNTIDEQIDVALTSVHRLPQPKALREVFAAIDETDVEHQTQDYCQLITLEGQTAVDQLRHRADMMRRRADEFDTMADSYQKAIDDIVRQTGSVNDTHQAILNLIADHAHIKPVRT